MEFKREINYTKYNSNYETVNTVDPILFYTIFMSTICGILMIGIRNAREINYIPYPNTVEVQEQEVPTAYFEESNYTYDVIDWDVFDKNNINIKKLTLK